jgi:hypothetical protein
MLPVAEAVMLDVFEGVIEKVGVGELLEVLVPLRLGLGEYVEVRVVNGVDV